MEQSENKERQKGLVEFDREDRAEYCRLFRLALRGRQMRMRASRLTLLRLRIAVKGEEN